MAMSRHLHISRAMGKVSHCEHMIRRMRPQSTWKEVLSAVNLAYPGNPLTLGQLRRSVHRLVEEGLLPKRLLTPVKRPRGPNRTMNGIDAGGGMAAY